MRASLPRNEEELLQNRLSNLRTDHDANANRAADLLVSSSSSESVSEESSDAFSERGSDENESCWRSPANHYEGHQICKDSSNDDSSSCENEDCLDFNGQGRLWSSEQYSTQDNSVSNVFVEDCEIHMDS